MDFHPLPPELIDLENRLRNRPDKEPTAALRGRVLKAAAAEAASEGQSWKARQADAWNWAAAAAAVIVVMNLSMISASQTEFSIEPAASPNQMKAEIQAIRLLASQYEGTSK